MGNYRTGRHGLGRAALIALLGGIAATACSSIPDEPAPVFMKGGMPGVADAAAAPGPGMAGPRPRIGGPPMSAAMPRADRQIPDRQIPDRQIPDRQIPDRQIPDRQITVERGQSLGKIAVQYHVPKQAIIAANHLEAPEYKVKIGSKLTIPGGAAPVQQAMAPRSAGPSPDVIPLDDLPAPHTSAAPPPAPHPAGPPAAAPMPPHAAAPMRSSNPPPSVAAVPPPTPAPQPASPPQPRPAPVTALAPQPAPPPQATPASLGPNKTIAFPPREPSAAEQARSEPAAPPPPIQSTGSRFPWPVQGHVLASYGVAADGTHNDGINIAASRGTPIKSVESGIVAYVGNELRGYGNLVLVKHTNGWISAYAHCDDVLVRKGDPVYKGQTIAKVGATGGVSEPQLHFELRQGKRPVDPRGFLDPAPSA
jgi:murein DD-endopeptidase MepM/ murein hydrolase activator NlpD